MLVIVQVPIVDVRPLLGVPTHRHVQPTFPHPDRVYARRSAFGHQTAFVAGVGPVRPRLRGRAGPWPSDNYYLDAESSIRFAANSARDETSRPLFRQFHTDGVAGRVEIGFHYPRSGPSHRAVRRTALTTPVHLPGGDEGPLMEFGPLFARHLLRSTTDSGRDGQPPSWWVSAGPVAVLTEVDSWAVDDSDFSRLDQILSGWLSYAWETYRGTRFLQWMLARPGTSREWSRRMRTGLSRLHADLHAYATIAGACRGGRVNPGESPLVDKYLRRTARRLGALDESTSFDPAFAAAVLDAAEGAYGDVWSMLRDDETAFPPDVRTDPYHLAVTVTDNQRRQPILPTGNTYNTYISGGTIGAVTTGSGDAHGQAAAGTDPRQLVEAIALAVRELRPHLSDDDAVAAEDTVEGLRREVDQSDEERNPERLSQRVTRLLALAAGAGEAGSAVAGAIEAFRTALGL